jgi:ferric-dicitrate binding protein FerR (iron transport regulator)
MSSREEFELLLEKRLDGNVTPEEQAKLKALLEQDAALRAEFLMAVSQEAALKAIHRKPEAFTAEAQRRGDSRSGNGSFSRNRRSWLMPLGVCAALAIAVLLYFMIGQSPPTPIARLKGPTSGVVVIRNNTTLADKAAFLDLFANDEIRSAENSQATIDYSDGTQVDLKGKVRAVFDPPGRTASGKYVRIQQGQLSATVSKQPANSPMIFASPQAEAVVLGTRLEIETDGNSTKLSVIEGKVRFTSLAEGKALEVASGEYAVAGKGVAFAVAPIASPAPAKSPRVQDGIVALYTFNEAAGETIKDSSGAGEALDLAVSDTSAVTWLKGGGLEVHGVTNISPAANAAKILKAVKNSGAISIEMWIKPAHIDPNTLRYVLTLHGGPGVHLLEIAQHGADQHQQHADWQFNLETVVPIPHHHATPKLAEGPRVTVSDGLAHLVFVRDAPGNAKVYVNGIEQGHGQIPGDLSAWDEQHFFSLAGDGSGRVWNGEFHLLAIYDRVLSADEIKKNFEANPQGQ